MERKLFFLASISGGLAVILGAFGAHALKLRVEPQFLTTFEIDGPGRLLGKVGHGLQI